MASSSLALPSTPCSSCVLGTLPDLLKHAMAQGGHDGVSAYLATELPHSQRGSKDDCRAQIRNDCALAEQTGMYAIFEDAKNSCRWTVELVVVNGIGGGDTGDAWWANPEHLAAMGVASAAEAVPSFLHQQEKNVGAGCSSRITAMRYYMKPDTWKQTFLSHGEGTGTTSLSAGEVSHSDSASTGGVTSSDPKGCSNDVHVHRQQTPSAFSTASSVVTAAATEDTSLLSAASSPLYGLPLHQLLEQHSALVRCLVQVLAPQCKTISHVIREVCKTRVNLPSSNVFSRVCIFPLTDASNAEPVQYTERDVAAAVEQLTFSNPRQPRLRELQSDGYLLMNLEEFADGKTRHKAANRAYPALAMHWPASAQQMDAMERYVDRDVVLDTRKRHPELSGEGSEKKKGRKRDRSLSRTSTSASDADEDGAHKAGASGSTSALPSPPLGITAEPTKTAPTSSSCHFFQSLREYPRSLEHGNLHAWARSTAAQKVRDCLQAATTLTQRSELTANASPDVAMLGPLPITNEEDVAVLRCQYDGLAAAESVLFKQLRGYGDTLQELRGWYRGELCTQQFRHELEVWLRTQEESRASLTDLYVQVHAVRYRLQRDLSNYLHMHALGVL